MVPERISLLNANWYKVAKERESIPVVVEIQNATRKREEMSDTSKGLQPQQSGELALDQMQFPVNIDVYTSGMSLPRFGTHGISNEQELLDALQLYKEGFDLEGEGARVVLTDANGKTIQASK